MPRLMLDLQSTQLSSHEQTVLTHPQVGGVILFSRNYADKSQLADLVQAVRQIRPELLIAVDHEGGRVQRFREGFTVLPPMASLARLWQRDQTLARQWAQDLGWLMASELVALDIDLSFAPVLDLDWQRSQIIGDRAFGQHWQQVSDLTHWFMQGMHQAGMAATGKHFPGHGWVQADSHVDIPVDERAFAQINAADMQPFQHLIKHGLDAIMPAHVIYSAVDPQPAGFSRLWLMQVLRGQLGFDGVIFSDDLSMQGASVAGDYPARAKAALAAGCDMLLVCNAPTAAVDVLTFLEDYPAAPTWVDPLRLRQRMVASEPDRLAAVSHALVGALADPALLGG